MLSKSEAISEQENIVYYKMRHIWIVYVETDVLSQTKFSTELYI